MGQKRQKKITMKNGPIGGGDGAELGVFRQ